VYTLLIIDDENIIRKGLQVMIEDLGLLFDQVIEAENGLQALQQVERYKPDIIILDIQMPHMDGMAFLEQIREEGSGSRVIICSGHQEFEYAKKAIRFKVTEYLLKPIKREDLAAALKLIIADLDQEQKKEEQPDAAIIERDAMLLRELLLHPCQDESMFQQYLQERSLVMPGPGCIVAYVQAAPLHAVPEGRLSGDFISLLDGRIKASFLQALTVPYRTNSVISIINVGREADRHSIGQSAASISAFFQKQGVQLSWGISRIGVQPVSLYTLSREAKAAYMEKLLYEKAGIYAADELPPPSSLLQFTLWDVTQINAMLRMQAYDGLILFMNQKCHAEELRGRVSAKEYQDRLIGLLLKIAERDGISDELYQFVEGLEECASLHDANRLFIKTIQRISIHHDGEGDTSSHHKSITYVKQYIQKNYQKSITLDLLANQVSMNASYFSVLFKREEGISLTDYIINVRVSKAMEYLRDPQFKIYEVATKTGFNDEKYFSKVFKKVVGFSPKMYKEKSSFHP